MNRNKEDAYILRYSVGSYTVSRKDDKAVCVIGEPRCIHPASTAAGLLQGLERSTGDDLRVVNDKIISAWAY